MGGVNSSMPHGVPSEYRIQSGDFVTMDYGAVVGGYHSDMTLSLIHILAGLDGELSFL